MRIAESHPWLEETWSRLLQARTRDRLPHALLFEGPDGMGKRWLGRQLARALLCRRPEPSGEGCGSCPACWQFDAGSHPDFLELCPEEDKASIRVDQVRGFCANLALSAEQAGGRRVALLHPADAMNLSAANSLLKTLEEPAPGRVILLVTERPGGLLPTIRSRCQRIRFTPPVAEAVLDWLMAQTGQPREDARHLLALVDGAPLAALALADADALARREAAFSQWLELARGRGDPFAVAADWSGVPEAQALHWMAGWLEDLVRLALAPGARVKNAAQRTILEKMAQHFAPDALLELRGRVVEAIRLWPSGVNVQLLLEDLLMDWSRLRGKT